MATLIHPSAVVEPGAEIGQDVKIGPYAVVEGPCRIGDRCRIDAHAQIKKLTYMGQENRVHSFACVGGEPQDLKYDGSDTTLEIGDRNTIREFATLNRGSEEKRTVVGSDCLFMAYSHVAHDCQLGNRVILANSGTLAGHVHVGSHVVIGGLSAVHQFVHLGDFAFVSGLTGVAQDIPPFMLCAGGRAKLRGLNLVGLRRAGFSNETIKTLKRAYRILWCSDLGRAEALSRIEAELPELEPLQLLTAFIRSSRRGVASGLES